MADYFVRNGRRMMGPFSRERLQQMADIGRISRSTQLSVDQRNWFAAGELEDLFASTVLIVPDDEVEAELPLPSGRVHRAVEPARRHMRSLPIAVAGGVVLLVGVVVALGLINGGRFDAGVLLGGTDPLIVSDPNDEGKIRDAIGMVVCGQYVLMRNGEERELLMSWGSGFLVSHDGFILTNRHVVDGIKKFIDNQDLLLEQLPSETRALVRRMSPILRVYINSTGFPARIIMVSDRFDMAVLRIECEQQPYFVLSEAAEQERNTPVYAIGFPSGATQELTATGAIAEFVRNKAARTIFEQFDRSDFTYTQTGGSISRMEEKAGAGQVLQHTANINKGNSGGPLINEDGVVVGINTFSIAQKDTHYAIGTRQLQGQLDRVIDGLQWW